MPAFFCKRRDLDKMAKKHQAARIELSKAQGMERVDLDIASKGWFNPRKVWGNPA